MTWFTWRQHRAEATAIGAVLTALGAVALITGLPMYDAYHHDGVAGCHRAGDTTDACARLIDAFRSEFAGLPMQAAGQLNFLPVLVAVLIGAPLLAREYERGTWQLVWTQAVPRTRWVVTTLALVLGGVAAAAIVLSVVLGWWLRPVVTSAFSVERFNYTAPVLAGYFLLAMAVGILAGAVIRRIIPAMAVALAVFLPLRLFVEFWLRPRYMTPVTTVEPAAGTGTLTEQIRSGDNWVLDSFLVGPNGHRLTDADEFTLFGGGLVDDADLAQHGLRQAVSYHPASRFWDFQLIESGIFLALALVLVLLAIWRVRRW